MLKNVKNVGRRKVVGNKKEKHEAKDNMDLYYNKEKMSLHCLITIVELSLKLDIQEIKEKGPKH